MAIESNRATALVIEDDLAIRRGILDALLSEGYATCHAGRGDDGLRMALEAHYDVLLLDLVLPIKSGMEILLEVRRARPTQPIIILTALGEEADRVRGLRQGADDYLVKPFSVQELLARIAAVLRRSPDRPLPTARLRLASAEVDWNVRTVQFASGEHADLSEKELEILRYLAENAGRIISRQEILQRVWRLSPDGLNTRTVDMHVARLREKLREAAASIVTVHGKGYRFETGGAP